MKKILAILVVMLLATPTLAGGRHGHGGHSKHYSGHHHGHRHYHGHGHGHGYYGGYYYPYVALAAAAVGAAIVYSTPPVYAAPVYSAPPVDPCISDLNRLASRTRMTEGEYRALEQRCYTR